MKTRAGLKYPVNHCRSAICWSDLSLESNLTPKSFSQSLVFILKVFTFKLTTWLVLTAYEKLAFISITFQKVVFKPLEQRYWSLLKELYNIFYIFSRKIWRIIIHQVCNINSLCIRNKSAKKVLNRIGPKIEPCSTPNITASHSLYGLLTLVLCFLCGR